MRPVCHLNCRWLPAVPTRQRLIRLSSDTSGALPPSGSAMTASACGLNIAPPPLVEGRRSAPECARTGCGGPPLQPSEHRIAGVSNHLRTDLDHLLAKRGLAEPACERSWPG